MKRAATSRTAAESDIGHQGLEETRRRFKASGYDLLAHPAHVIRRAHQRATTCFQEVVREKNLTPTQLAALATIMQHGHISQNRLGRITAMDPSTISIVVRKLLKLGLVVCSSSASDQRLSIIRLTDKGVRYTLPLLAQTAEVGHLVLSPLTAREQRTFMRLLQKVVGTNTSGMGQASGRREDGAVAGKMSRPHRPARSW
ncbi:MAG: MarR family transcriptional regulator [Bauldia sp.]|nr:MarR family transcriptional regulator [Bauldia sp.]